MPPSTEVIVRLSVSVSRKPHAPKGEEVSDESKAAAPHSLPDIEKTDSGLKSEGNEISIEHDARDQDIKDMSWTLEADSEVTLQLRFNVNVSNSLGSKDKDLEKSELPGFEYSPMTELAITTPASNEVTVLPDAESTENEKPSVTSDVVSITRTDRDDGADKGKPQRTPDSATTFNILEELMANMVVEEMPSPAVVPRYRRHRSPVAEETPPVHVQKVEFGEKEINLDQTRRVVLEALMQYTAVQASN